jgi:sugar-specific transcriptional regulator TrmB
MVSINEESIQTLIQLGLTSLEARVYLTLVEEGGQGTAGTISKLSKVNQPDVYRIAIKLERRGLIEKIISDPIMYKAKPIGETLVLLVESKNAQINALKIKTEDIAKKYDIRESQKKAPSPNKASELILIPPGRPHIHKIGEAIRHTDERVFGCGGDITVLEKARFLDESIWIEAIKRGVEFRFITEKRENSIQIPKLNRFLRKNPRVTMRCIDTQLPPMVLLLDEKEVFIRTEMSIESPVLRTTNLGIVKMAKLFLDAMWEKAQPYK